MSSRQAQSVTRNKSVELNRESLGSEKDVVAIHPPSYRHAPSDQEGGKLNRWLFLGEGEPVVSSNLEAASRNSPSATIAVG